MTTPTLESLPEVDPRFRARRVAVRRDEGRRRLRRLLILGAIVAASLLAFLLTRSALLDVDHIVIKGNGHTPAELVLRASGIHAHQPMTDVDLGRARRQLEALPWVESASVARDWPATVTVELRERTAIAAVPAGQGDAALVDRAGRVLEVDATPPPGLVALAGVPAPGQPGESLDATAADALQVVGALGPRVGPQVATVARTPDGVELWLRDGGKVKLGSTSDLGAKLTAAATVLGQVDLSELCALDVRVPSAPSLTRARACL